MTRAAVPALLALVGLALLAPLAGRAGEGPAPSGRTVQQGIAVELVTGPAAGGKTPAGGLVEGTEASIRFRLSDTATGTPLAGASPAAWLDSAEGRDARGSCTEAVEQYVGGSFFHRPTLDLNAYRVLSLNDDASISIIDPLSGFGGSKLLAQAALASPGDDWVLTPDGSRLFVSQPVAGKVAAIDTTDWKVTAQIDAGPRPGRLAVEPDGSRVWVAGSTGVAAIDASSLKVVGRIEMGADDLALSGDGHRLFVAGRAARTLTVIDTARLARIGDVALPAAPTAVAWSPLAHAAYAVAGEEGKIFAVDPERLVVTATVAAEPGLGALRFAPGGRFGVVPNPRGKTVQVLDAASNRIVQSGEMAGVPDQVTFSDTLVYVRQRESDAVLMIPLAGLGEEGHGLSVADFAGGEHPPFAGEHAGELSARADAIVRAPEPGAVLVANPADGAIYYYREGMAAPMGSFQGYGRPRAVLVVDRSLKERSPGSYETVARLPGPGRYRLAFFLDAPRTVRCFDVAVAADPVLAAKRLRERPVNVAPRIASRTVPAGKPTPLRFRITDPTDDRPLDGLADVEVLTFLSSGSWQQRQPARPVGDGTYEVEFVPPGVGSYHVAVECPSGRLAFNRSPQVVLRAVEAKP
ncbi:MAG TPA: cytochrome D1 [Thermoanaerobaculia bacterium]